MFKVNNTDTLSKYITVKLKMEPLVPAVKLVFQLDGMLQETSQSAITCLK